ncbi:MAG: hypothetical protein CEE38_17455 [Planctomycetes bacterium B3_Pla]|nr:MAG: hypothetical protein CEE38_17455 [Planctomycetes bacterium B3_Pla]
MDERNIAVRMDYLDKVCANFRDTTKIIGRLLYILLLLFFLIVYLVASSPEAEPGQEQQVITISGVKIPTDHAILISPIILGFIYMAIGAFSIYKGRMSKAIIGLYKDMGLEVEILDVEENAGFLKYPSFTDTVSFLSKSGEEESESIAYTLSFINFLRTLFVYVIPLMILIFLWARFVYQAQGQFLTVLSTLSSYLLLPGVGVVLITWEFHNRYYEGIKKKLEKCFSNRLAEGGTRILTWGIGTFVIDLAITVFFIISFVLSLVLLKKDILASYRVLIYAWLSSLLISGSILFIGCLFRKLLVFLERFKKHEFGDNIQIKVKQTIEHLEQLERIIKEQPQDKLSETAKKKSLEITHDALKDVARRQLTEAAKKIWELGNEVGPTIVGTAAHGFFENMMRM